MSTGNLSISFSDLGCPRSNYFKTSGSQMKLEIIQSDDSLKQFWKYQMISSRYIISIPITSFISMYPSITKKSYGVDYQQIVTFRNIPSWRTRSMVSLLQSGKQCSPYTPTLRMVGTKFRPGVNVLVRN